MRKFFSILLIVILTLSLVSCGAGEEAGTIAGIDLPKSVEMKAGETLSLKPEFLPAGEIDAAFQKETASLQLQWTSSDEAVAVVSSSGTVAAVAAGEAEITLKAGEYTAVVSVTVTEEEKEDAAGTVSFTLEADDVVMATLSDPMMVLYRVQPSDAEIGEIEMTSSDETVVKVRDGRLYPGAKGTATVTLTSGTVSTEFLVTVLQAPKGLYVEDFIVQLGQPEKITVDYGIKDPETGTEVTFTSEDETVCLVDEEGRAIGVSVGDVFITVENEFGQSYTFMVTVVDPTPSAGGNS